MIEHVEVVIKIPRDQYSVILLSNRSGVASFIDKEAMMYAIKNGTPLPEGHGDLVDVGQLYADMKVKEALARERVTCTPAHYLCHTRYVVELNERTAFMEMLSDALPIIHADKSENEE